MLRATSTLARRSAVYIPIHKADQVSHGDSENDHCVSHELLCRGGFISGSAGLYSLLPLGQRVLDKIEGVINEEMQGVGGQKCSFEHVQREALWQQTGRWEGMGREMFRLHDRRGGSFCLAPTHEELVTQLVARTSSCAADSWPTGRESLRLYQIGRKYRDEPRPRFGLLRAKEFVMKDMYSFDRDEHSARQTYEAVVGAYDRVFRRLGLPVVRAAASGGSIGGSVTHEFHIVADAGQDEVLQCDGCQHCYNAEVQQQPGACPACGLAAPGSQIKRVGIEVGHTFLLGDKYSSVLGATTAGGGDQSPFYMGCYGIGVSRLIAAAVEQNHDKAGVRWPLQIAPYRLAIVTIGKPDDAQLNHAAESAHQSLAQLPALANEMIWHDEARGAGHKLTSCELLGYPFVLVIGSKWKETGRYELRVRSPSESTTHANLSLSDVVAVLGQHIDNAH